jgi:hypothetical protein
VLGLECGGRGGEPRECGEEPRGGRAAGWRRVRAAGAIRSGGGRMRRDGVRLRVYLRHRLAARESEHAASLTKRRPIVD